MTFAWKPLPEWKGRPAVIVAPGPSLDLKTMRHIGIRRNADQCRVIAINDAIFAAWFADICFAGDGKWWNARGGLPRFAQKRVGLAESRPADNAGDLVKHYLSRVGTEGCSLEPGLVFTNGNSGAMATQLAAQLGAHPIVLVGFDMHDRAGRHFFGAYEQQNLHSESDMSVWVENFRAIAAALEGRLFNATRGSALDFIPFVDLAAAIGPVHGNAR